MKQILLVRVLQQTDKPMALANTKEGDRLTEAIRAYVLDRIAIKTSRRYVSDNTRRSSNGAYLSIEDCSTRPRTLNVDIRAEANLRTSED